MEPDIEAHSQDFDDCANDFWSLYGKEAESYDRATIKDIKNDMDGLLIFAGLFSAALTAFVIDRSQSIQPTPAQQSAFYQQQSLVLLNQISQQLSSLGAQTSGVSANLSLPGFGLSPSASDVRVNIFWIISLIFSLSAALLATLVQQWARDHMHIFQRYSHPLRIARIRQYLHEGIKTWRMRAIAEAVPALVHISLFLFLLGLADFLLNAYAIVGKFTLFPITLCATVYIISTAAPVINPQSPCRTPFSSLVWYIAQKLWTRTCYDRFGANQKPLSSNMADGRMQLAMEKNDARKGRDERAVGWLLDNLTCDTEMDPLASGIPGSFDATWGVEVWKSDPKIKKDEFYSRIGRFFETCNDRGSFMNEDEWRRRSRACVETVASLVFCMDAHIDVFGDIGKLLSDLGSAERTHEVSETSLNRSFTTRWTCLSLVATRKMLNSPQLQRHANGIILKLGALHPEDAFAPSEAALKNAQKIDEQFAAAWRYVERLRTEFKALGKGDRSGIRAQEVLHQHEPKLIPIRDQVERMERLGVDASISELQNEIDEATHNLTRQLPGVVFDHFTGPSPIDQVFDFLSNPVRPQLIYLSQLLLGLCTVSRKRSSLGYQDTTKVLQALEKIPSSLRQVVHQHRLAERQLWRLQDLSVGGGFGFTLELYFLSLRQILSTSASPPKETQKAFYISTFKAITFDWEQFKNSSGTLQILLNLVYDIAVLDRGIFSNYAYPIYITNELLELLGKMVEGREDVYVDDVTAELWFVDRGVRDQRFRDDATMAILGDRDL